MSEKDILRQSLSDADLNEVSGGSQDPDAFQVNCTRGQYRNIYGGKRFPNCAASVEDGSWCWTSDSCFSCAVLYTKTKECVMAWK